MKKDADSKDSNSEQKHVGRTAGEAVLRTKLETGLTAEKRKSIGEKLRSIDFGDAASKTQQALDESEPEESVDNSEEESVDEDEKSDSEESTDEETEAGSEQEIEPEVEPEEESDAGETKVKNPTLPEAYRRSLKARSWGDDEIDGFLKADPELAMKTFDRIHKSRNAEIAAFAEAGRAVQAQTQGSVPNELKVANVEELVAKYGSEDVVKALVNPVNDSITQLNSVIPELRAGLQIVRRLHQDQLLSQIEGFFGSDAMRDYAEVYGTLKTGRSGNQTEKFHKVLDLADQIRAGSLAQGRQDVSVEDALLAAHESLIGDYRAKVVRSKIKKETKQRQAGITLKPGAKAKATGPTGDKTKDRAALERRVREGMRKAGLLR